MEVLNASELVVSFNFTLVFCQVGQLSKVVQGLQGSCEVRALAYVQPCQCRHVPEWFEVALYVATMKVELF